MTQDAVLYLIAAVIMLVAAVVLLPVLQLVGAPPSLAYGMPVGCLLGSIVAGRMFFREIS